MTVERIIRIIAGSFILLSLALAHIYNEAALFNGPIWLWFTALSAPIYCNQASPAGVLWSRYS